MPLANGRRQQKQPTVEGVTMFSAFRNAVGAAALALSTGFALPAQASAAPSPAFVIPSKRWRLSQSCV
jgi:hypothetical protein